LNPFQEEIFMSWFTKQRLFSLILVLSIPALAAAMISLPEDDRTETSLDQLPKSIQKALAGLDIDEIEVTSVYEIDVEEDGVEVELRVDRQGRLLGIEIERQDDDDEDDEDDEDEDEDEER